MAFGTAGKGIMGPLLLVNFVLYSIVVGLASWSLDKYINGENHQCMYMHFTSYICLNYEAMIHID